MGHIITHPNYGVFIGELLGFAFWSKLEDIGSETASLFNSVDAAVNYINTWSDKFEDLEIVAVENNHKEHLQKYW